MQKCACYCIICTVCKASELSTFAKSLSLGARRGACAHAQGARRKLKLHSFTLDPQHAVTDVLDLDK